MIEEKFNAYKAKGYKRGEVYTAAVKKNMRKKSRKGQKRVRTQIRGRKCS